MFHDRARIHVVAGRGGDGSLHFRREKHVPKGGPDGGDGGPGGHVVLVADPDLRDLSGFRRRRWFKAGNGEPGRGALKHGAIVALDDLPEVDFVLSGSVAVNLSGARVGSVFGQTTVPTMIAIAATASAIAEGSARLP